MLYETFAAPFRRPAVLVILLYPMLAMAGPPYAAWGPDSEAPDVDGSVLGGCPIESRDGLSIYTASARPGGQGSNDIWVNNRPSLDAPFGEAINLPPPVNSPDADFCPSPLRGNWLMFVSTRDGGCGIYGDGTGDIYIIRDNPAQGWGEPHNLGCGEGGPNTAGAEFSPSLVETDRGTFLYYSTNGYSGNQDLYVSEMLPDGSFTPGSPVAELNTEFDDRMPTVSKDGLEIVYSSDRPLWAGGTEMSAGSWDVYYSRRASLDAPWSEPINVSVTSDFSTKAAGETRASLSWDRERLYYGSGGEIYVSERVRLRGNGQ